MDQGKARDVNEAARRFAETLADSYYQLRAEDQDWQRPEERSEQRVCFELQSDDVPYRAVEVRVRRTRQADYATAVRFHLRRLQAGVLAVVGIER